MFSNREAKVKYQQALRKKVADAGLYKKHSVDCRLLIGFKGYLKKDLNVVNCTQEVSKYYVY